MRIRFSGIIPITAAGILVALAVPSSAQRANEISLLGIKVWNRYSDVMQKFGPPTRIEVGMASGNAGGGGGQLGAMGGGSSMGMAGGGGKAGMPSFGGAGMGGSPSGGQGMMGGGKSGMPGFGGMGMGGSSMGMAMGGRSGMAPGGGMGSIDGPSGGPGMGSSMGSGMSLGGDTGGSTGEDGEVSWVYERGPVTNYFLFNKDGRVIQIQSFGYAGPAVTSKGIKQGDSVSKVYGAYGWTSLITKDSATNTMTLDYSKERNAYFQLADRKDGKGYRVVGITIGIVDKAQIKSLGPAGSAMGNPAGMGGSGIAMGSSMGARMGGGKGPAFGGSGMGAPAAGGGRGKMGGGAAAF